MLQKTVSIPRCAAPGCENELLPPEPGQHWRKTCSDACAAVARKTGYKTSRESGEKYPGARHYLPVVRDRAPISEADRQLVAENPLPKRSECRGGYRPCPLILCKYNLYLDVDSNSGAIGLNFPDLQPWEMTESCALDVAERAGGEGIAEVGGHMNVTKQRVQQIEQRAIGKLKRLAATQKIEDLREEKGDSIWDRILRNSSSGGNW